MAEIRLTLDTTALSAASINVKQYDADALQLLIAVQVMGSPLNISDSGLATFSVARTDGEKKAYVGTIEDGKVRVNLNSWHTAVAGEQPAELSVYDGGRLTTYTFSINVIETVVDPSEIISPTDAELISELIARTEEATTEATEAAGTALTAASEANTATANANTAAESATAAAQTATEAAERAEEAATAASEQAEQARTAGQNANVASIFAQTAGNSANTAAGNATAAAQTATEAAERAEEAATDVETAIANANTAADNANTKAIYAQTQGDYAKEQGDYASEAARDANALLPQMSTAKTACETATAAAQTATQGAETATAACESATSACEAATEDARDVVDTAESRISTLEASNANLWNLQRYVVHAPEAFNALFSYKYQTSVFASGYTMTAQINSRNSLTRFQLRDLREGTSKALNLNDIYTALDEAGINCAVTSANPYVLTFEFAANTALVYDTSDSTYKVIRNTPFTISDTQVVLFARLGKASSAYGAFVDYAIRYANQASSAIVLP